MAVVPTLLFEIDFTNDPSNVTRVYTDVTSYVRGIGWTRGGRNNELQRTTAGTLNAVLSNSDGRFDPTNTGSPYYPGVKRMRWCRASAVWSATTYRQWTGLIEVWKQEWPEAGYDATVSITATDSFKILNLFDLNGLSFGSQLPGDRVASVCAAVGLPSLTAPGSETLPAVGPFPADSMALPHLLDVEETENGTLFCAADGTVTFQDRHYVILNQGSTNGTIGDTLTAGSYGSLIPYRVGELDLDDADIYNSVYVTPAGGTAENAQDATSISQHFKRPLNRSLLSTSQDNARYIAQYLAALYGDPGPRIPAVEIVGAANTTVWPTILAMKNLDRFTWKRTASAHTIQQDVFIQQVTTSVNPNTTWDVTVQLSPAADQAGWILQDAVYGLLNQTTVTVY